MGRLSGAYGTCAALNEKYSHTSIYGTGRNISLYMGQVRTSLYIWDRSELLSIYGTGWELVGIGRGSAHRIQIVGSAHHDIHSAFVLKATALTILCL